MFDPDAVSTDPLLAATRGGVAGTPAPRLTALSQRDRQGSLEPRTASHGTRPPFREGANARFSTASRSLPRLWGMIHRRPPYNPAGNPVFLKRIPIRGWRWHAFCNSSKDESWAPAHATLVVVSS